MSQPGGRHRSDPGISRVAAGIVVVDKPSGITSHDVVSRCRRAFGTRKVGHAGTLDPMATGVLVVGIERATKILGIFARLSKRDGKHGYLRHIPRVSRYLERNLAHPKLQPLKAWFDRHLPPSQRERQQ